MNPPPNVEREVPGSPRRGTVAQALTLGIFAACARAAASPSQSIAVDHGWQFHQAGSAASSAMAQWRDAQVPGDVHLDLLRHGLIPDPFYRDNEAKLQWISTADWEYRTTVDASPELLGHRHLELVFEGLDAFAEVYVNGDLALTADNMFRTWRIDLKGRLHPGANEIRVVFPDQDKAAARIAARDPWFGRTSVAAKTYVRKAAYEHGWDWGPAFVTSGIWRPVKLEAWDVARISDLHIRQRDVTAAVAHLDAVVEVTADADTTADLHLAYGQGKSSSQFSERATLHPGVNHLDVPIEIEHPERWFPAGYGAQPRYRFTAELSAGGAPLDSRQVWTGLRTVVLRRDVDRWGRSFEFVVNGIPVFVKGADVIPFDSFPNRAASASYRRILESAKDANMNAVRQWGGGYYESDEFYDLCDELGLMVWQDFMFGNEMQPGTYPFKLNVAQEARDQLRRLRNHPCMLVWCGNNETESALGWNPNKSSDPAVRLQMWKDYITISGGILGQAVRELSPETPYWPSSPSSDYEATSPEYESGDVHDWSVWHGRAPFSDYEKHHFRFVSEYGFQSFPELRTVESYTALEDRGSIFSPVMLAHQKSPQGNALIQEYMLRDYPQPKDFESFLYVSQVLQAEGIKVGAEHLRRERPRCMGSMFWQLNDCWPVASWSSIDYDGRWKALQYYARRFYAPVLVSPHLEGDALALYVVSDRTTATNGQLNVRLFSLTGAKLRDETLPIDAAPLASRVCWRKRVADWLPAGTDPAGVFVCAELKQSGETLSRNIAYLAPTKDIRLPLPHLDARVTGDGGSYRVRVHSDVVARSVQLSFGKIAADPLDDYFDILPGESVEVTVKSAASLDELQRSLRVRSLADAFASTPGSP